MSIFLSAVLELTPDRIPANGGAKTIGLKYAVGATTKTRACDRMLVGGVEQLDKQCYPVTGTLNFQQPEMRSVVVRPPAATDFVEIQVLVREVDADNGPTAPEQQCSAQLRIDRT
jgi:hypothetical protein